mmetsp:Transcript_38165/g.87312  ORF Transcript_38165/g.87312 Transcript_38165/m.87312 type:complete len:286 (-) Transcript_38165:75-932(-)
MLLDLGSDHRLLELRVSVKDHREVADGDDGADRLLVHVARLLELRLSDEEICEGAPQMPGLVGKRAQPRAENSLHSQPFHLQGVLADQFAQLHPERVPTLPFDRGEVLTVEQLGQLERCLRHPLDRQKELDVLLDAVGLKLQVPPVDAHGGLLHRTLARKAEVELPNPLVLRDRQRAQRAVERVPRRGRRGLREEKLEVIDPDARHLVHVHERTLVRAVEPLDPRVPRLAPAHLPPPVLQVRAPDLETPREVLERTLGDHVALPRRRALLGIHVAPPVLERVRIA